ncbi:peptidase inhibitor clitocypin domain-containing protein [Ceratobasidium sp. AG-Ba]|nr:peptidase inhibitor clitocypin domain-containing protein [Ceratobasidium sp. AG-Ba]QRW04133.1 peptidase inhibitor clitocypin domain-containing protein [Ceratobasidium sp. AG-Ba]
MSEFPFFNKYVSLLYLHKLPEGVPEIGGMYATMPDTPGGPVKLEGLHSGNPNSHKWRIVPNVDGVGVTVQGYFEPNPDEGILPVGIGPAWKNYGPAPGTPITISSLIEASSYNLTVVRKYETGWIISLQPTDPYDKLGVNRYIGRTEANNDVAIAGVPVYPDVPFPGWYVSID